MSIDSIRFHCTGCEYEYLEHFQPIKLKCRIGDEVVTYYRTTAWCNHCDTIRYVEHIPVIEELEQEHEELPAPAPEEAPPGWIEKLFNFILDRVFKPDNPFDANEWKQERINNQKNLIAWRQARTAPPHCLTCGSTDLTPIDFEQIDENTTVAKDFRHSCGGQLIRNNNDDPGIRFHFSDTVIWMDIDGNKLVDDEPDR